MFYDVDILNRRGGKFGLVWLAAHKRLRMKERNADYQAMLKIDVGKMCKEIDRYIKVLKPPEGMDSPRFSLHLAALLTRGIISIHYAQVRHDVAKFEQIFINKAAADIADRNRLSVVGGDGIAAMTMTAEMIENAALNAAVDYGTLATGFYERHVAGIHLTAQSPRQWPGCDQGVGPFDNLLTASGTDEDVDVESSFSIHLPHLTTIDKITLREVDPERPTDTGSFYDPVDGEIPVFTEGDYFGEPMPLPFSEEEEIPLLQGEDAGAGGARPRRPPPKRGRDSPTGHTPLKRPVNAADLPVERFPVAVSTPVPEPMDVDAVPVVDPVPVPDNLVMVLQPLEAQANANRRRGRRRLIIDRSLQISDENFKAQLEDVTVTLRVQTHIEDHADIQPTWHLMKNIFIQPGRNITCMDVRERITRNMVIRPIEDAPDSPILPLMRPLQRKRAAREAGAAVADDIPAGIVRMEVDGEQELPVDTDVPIGHPLANEVPFDVPTDDAPPTDVPTDVTNADYAMRHESRDPSILSALGASRVDVSSKEGSRLVANASPDRNRLQVLPAVIEASVEASTRGTLDPRTSSLAPNAPARGSSVQVAGVNADSPFRRPSSLVGPKTSCLPARVELSPIPSVHSAPRDEIPEGADLMAVIEEMMESEETTVITFKMICSPTRNTKRQAAKYFANLLELAKRFEIVMDQTVAYGDILIRMPSQPRP